LKPSKLKLSLLPEILAICSLEKDARIPVWALAGRFFSITRTMKELSVVCPQSQVPQGIQRDEGWRCLKVEDSLDVSGSGFLASLTTPLADEGINAFVVSTYQTDYLLVEERFLRKAITVLAYNGHQILHPYRQIR